MNIPEIIKRTRPAFLYFAIITTFLILNAVVFGRTAQKFQIRPEKDGAWIIESTDVEMQIAARVAKNQEEAGSWIVQRMPDQEEADKIPVKIVGQWTIELGRLVFRPKYPFRIGQDFRVIEIKDFDEPEILFSYKIPIGGGPDPEIVSMEPASKTWPENLLRVYLHFNRPMSRGEANRLITITDESGRELIQPFLQLDQELWDRDGKRLTLLFDPGRVKKGLKPREEDGAILEKGNRYTIKIASGWPDARGIAIKTVFEKTIEVSAADEKPIDPRKWKITAPMATSDSLLKIQFDEKVDTGMALRMIQILESGECPLDGASEISPDGLSFQFKPQVKWSPGLHFIEINPALEDPSGNQVGKPFERNIQADKQSLMQSAKPVRLTFIVKAIE